MKNFFCLLLLLSSVFSYAQSKEVKLSGRITTVDNDPLEELTVYLRKSSDSTIINYSITDVTGKFELSAKPQDEPVTFAVAAVGFQTFKKNYEKLTESVSLGQIKLEDTSELLSEIVIETEQAPIRIKNDTIEFNASSFKVRPDATVKELLEQLPGVRVAEDGSITVNGKSVNNVLVNGKPFFGEDGKIALENLPADIINKVQISDFKTKEQKFTGEKGSATESSINLTIDEDKNKGQFGRLTAGYGTNDRYESNLLFNNFKGDRKFSVLASSNNINSSGFSMDEVFDNMSGGRNDWQRNSTFIDDFNYFEGITTNNLLGVNYNNSYLEDKLSFVGSYILKDADNHTKSESYTQHLLPENKMFTSMNDESNNFSNAHTFSAELEYNPNEKTRWVWAPNFELENVKSFNTYEQFINNDNNQLINSSVGNSSSENDSRFFTNYVSYNYRLKDKSSISFRFENKNRVSDSDQILLKDTKFYSDSSLDDYRDQQSLKRTTEDSYSLESNFRKIINKSNTITFGLTNEFSQNTDNQKVFNKEMSSGLYQENVGFLTWDNRFSNYKVGSYVYFNHTPENKLHYSISLGNEMNFYKIDTQFLNETTINKRVSILPDVALRLNHKLTKDWSYSANYSLSGEIPEFSNLLPFENRNSTTSTIIGNPDLLEKIHQRMFLNLNNYNYQARTGFYVYASLSHNFRDVVMTSSIDENLFTTYRFENIKNTYYYSLGSTFTKDFKIGDHVLKPEIGFNFYNTYNKGFINNVEYKTYVNYFSPRLRMNWKYKEWFSISPSYAPTMSNASYENYVIDQSKVISHEAKLSITTYVPKNVTFGSDLTYENNPNVGEGLKNDFLLWNVSLGYSFLNDQLTAKVKGYDLLNQNQSVSRYNSGMTIVDSKRLVMQRYVMFSLTYKLKPKSGSVPKPSSSSYIIIHE